MTTQSKSTHRGAGEGTIYKDTVRNRWVAQVTVGYDGRTGRLIRRSKSARTRKEAQAALAALKEKYASQTAILASRMTVGLWLDLEALCSFGLQNVINKRLYNHYREALIEAPSIYYCWRQMMLVEFMTGLRRGELLALHWEDLNLEEGWLKSPQEAGHQDHLPHAAPRYGQPHESLTSL